MTNPGRGQIAPFYVMEVMAAAAEREKAGGDVLHLEVGQPSTGAPAGVIAAAHDALDTDRLGYTAASGIPALRDRLAEHYQARYGVTVDPDRIFVTQGASGACVLSFLAAFDVGARVAVTEPGYPCYRNMLQAFGVDVVGIAVGPETRYQPTPELLAAAGPLDGIVVASPSNPTGTMIGAAELGALVGWCEQHNVRFVADEIYHGISYGHPTPTALASSDNVLVVNSFSKYFSMTGWRLGWMVVPESLSDTVVRLAQNLYISAPTLAQLAAVAAFDCRQELDANLVRYAANREVLLDGLPEIGLTELAPADGAFYVWADVSELTDDSTVLCAQWLDELGVAATPGVDFDPHRGHRYVRFSFSESTEDVTEAVNRLKRWRAGRRGGSTG